MQILTHCDVHSLGLILSCMPNLHEFSFTFIMERFAIPFNDVLLDGNIWQNILTIHVPYLNKFDIHISVMREELFGLKSILDSFRCFVTQYDGWHMAVSRWETFEKKCKLKKRRCLFDSSHCSPPSTLRAFFFVLFFSYKYSLKIDRKHEK